MSATQLERSPAQIHEVEDRNHMASQEVGEGTDREIADILVDEFQKEFVVLTSCSVYQGIEARLRERTDKIQIIKTNHEHSLAGITGGLIIAGKRAMAMSQNSAGFNAFDGFHTYANQAVNSVPILYLMSWRKDKASEPHWETGQITDPLTRLVFGEDGVFGTEDGANFLEELRSAEAMVKSGRMAVIRMPEEAFIDAFRYFPVESDVFDEKEYHALQRKEAYIAYEKGTFTPKNPFPHGKNERRMDKADAYRMVYEHYMAEDPYTRFVISNGFGSRTALGVFGDDPNVLLLPGYMGGGTGVGFGMQLAEENMNVVIVNGNENFDMSTMEKHLKLKLRKNLHLVTIDDGVASSVGGAPSMDRTTDVFKLSQVIQVRPDQYDIFVTENPRVQESAKRTKIYIEEIAKDKAAGLW